MSQKYDVIIIGAGISGLICGTYLVKRGLKVLILEQHFIPGGCCSSFRRKDFLFDAGAHIFGSCGRGQTADRILEGLDIENIFLRMDPTDVVHFPNDQVNIPKEIDAFVDLLQNQNKKERDNIQKLVDAITRFTDPSEVNAFIRKYSTATFQDFLDEYIKDQRTKAILSAQSGYVGLRPDELSAITAVLMFKSYNIDGSYYPQGGSQEFTNLIVAKFKELGGDLLLSHKVKKIVVQNKKITGVETSDEKVFFADTVVSSGDVKNVYASMLEEEEAQNKRIMKKINNYDISMSVFALYLGVEMNKRDLMHKNGWYHTSYDINESFNEQYYLAIPTLYDQSLTDSSVRDIIISYSNFPMKYCDVKNWKKNKDDLKLKTRTKVKSLFAEKSMNILVEEAATPKTFEHYTLNTCGSIYGWAQTPRQVFINSFPVVAPLDGLFFTGHWSYPGGGIVSVMISGMHTARHVTKRFKLSKEPKG